MIKPEWNAPANILAFTRFSSDYLLNEPMRFLKQVHGSEAVLLPMNADDPVSADASITRTPEIFCCIRTADCLPILITNLQGTEIAAIHAGWRGLAAGIIENTFAKMQSAPQDCIAWFGPAICKSCFEVGEEVLQAFLEKQKTFSAYFVKSAYANTKFFANLSGIAEAILQNLGLSRVYFSQVCTVEDLRCNSYRRQKGTDQRMITAIRIMKTTV